MNIVEFVLIVTMIGQSQSTVTKVGPFGSFDYCKQAIQRHEANIKTQLPLHNFKVTYDCVQTSGDPDPAYQQYTLDALKKFEEEQEAILAEKHSTYEQWIANWIRNPSDFQAFVVGEEFENYFTAKYGEIPITKETFERLGGHEESEYAKYRKRMINEGKTYEQEWRGLDD